MRAAARSTFPDISWLANAPVLMLVPLAIALIFWYAPTEDTMGDVQRIVYLHVSVAWCGLAGCLSMGACGALYLIRRNLAWDHWSQACGEVGWLGATLTLVTGSLWAHEAWGVWWTWEPRLTFSLVLWLIFAGIFLVRSSVEDSARRARLGAVLAVLGAGDAPLVFMATRWFRGVHPVAPEMDARMRLVLLIAVVSFSALFLRLCLLRRRQLEMAERVEALEMHGDLGSC
jgi:heme exporter protein C